jgi:hypothetical protein
MSLKKAFLSPRSLPFFRPPGALAGEMRCPLLICSSILIYWGMTSSMANVHEQQGPSPTTCSARSDRPCPVGSSSIYADECVRVRIPLSRRAAVFDRAASAIRLCVGEDRIGGETDPLGASFLCAQACSLQAGAAICTWDVMAYAANEVRPSLSSLLLSYFSLSLSLSLSFFGRWWVSSDRFFFSFLLPPSLLRLFSPLLQLSVQAAALAGACCEGVNLQLARCHSR